MKLIVGNLKMYMSLPDIIKYVEGMDGIYTNVVVCPTSIYVPYFLKRGFKVGLQNVFYENNGSYTGEISPKQAFELGIDYVILGHSERRKHFNETNEIINKKIKKSLENNLKVILCVGENDEEAKPFISNQLQECLKDINEEVIIAYEPIKAIGTGVIPTIEYINEIISFIKDKGYNTVLYGGSVDENNALDILNVCDGLLIGRAATDVNKFKKIIEIGNNKN